MLRIHVDDRQYRSFRFVDNTEIKDVDLEINPLTAKLFNDDIFKYENGIVSIIQSTTRSHKNISGILVLDNQKTYGKIKDKFLYRCIPNDKRLPEFLIPYLCKNRGFSKKMTNLYIIFAFSNWNSKHPIGVIQNNLGPTDQLTNFYEYQLYCKSLNASISIFTQTASRILKNTTHSDCINDIIKKNPNFENRQDVTVISIDPGDSKDFDDALSFRRDTFGYDIVSIYIANVTVWLEALNLWDSFSERVATIYLPDRKRPMLPTILSDCLCSLVQNEIRFAFTLDLKIKNGIIESTSFCNSIIKVHKNYTYEEPRLLKDSNYLNIMESLKSLIPNYKYIDRLKDSHDVVAYSMIIMNYLCAQNMMQFKNGIYRAVAMNKSYNIPEHLPTNVKDFIKIWTSCAGQYVAYQLDMRHELLKFDSYIHITSPIRRLVDLLNIISMQNNLQLINFNKSSNQFYDTWFNRLEYINTTMRSIRRIQTDCNLLHLCSTQPDVLTKNYVGYVFDRIDRSDNLFQYTVYLPELKLTNRIIICDKFAEYANKQFNIYLFTDEAKLKQKIRLQIC
jgi:exoribonuclease R